MSFFQQALELEMDTYSGIVKEMGTMAESMIKSSHPESKMIKDRQQVLDTVFIYSLIQGLSIIAVCSV